MSTKASLQAFASRAGKARAVRDGLIAFNLTGRDGGRFNLTINGGETRLAPGAPERDPLFEVIGDARKVTAVLNGSKDARLLFLAGGFRVRGDLRFVSALAHELGILRQPL